jgi:hypothetical protein
MSLAAPAHVKALSQGRKLVSVSAISVLIIRYPSVHFWLFGIHFVLQSVKDFLNLEITAYLSTKRILYREKSCGFIILDVLGYSVLFFMSEKNFQ